jgi:hypothetical protein
MTDIIALGTVGLAHIGGLSTVAPGYFSDHGEQHDDALDYIIENISDAGKDSYRSDMISDVNAGLGVMATGIRVISAILTVLGGTGNRRQGITYFNYMPSHTTIIFCQRPSLSCSHVKL